MYRLLAYNFQGKPAIKGHGAGIIGKNRLLIEKDLTLPDGAKLYEIEDNDRINTYFDITSIESYWNEAFDNVEGKDYLFIRDRVVQLVKQKAYNKCLLIINDPGQLTPNEGDYFEVGTEPIGVFKAVPGAIAIWDGEKFDFYDPDVLGYNLCSQKEKEICARLYIGLIPQHKADFGVKETFEWREEYHVKATANRYLRMRKAESYVEEELPQYAGYILFYLMSKVRTLKNQEVAQLDLHKLFKDVGVKGTIEDARPVTRPFGEIGIIDWFFGRNTYAYDFSTEGLINQSFATLSGITIEEFCDRVYEILILGV